jgi:hypothetical protein
MFNLRIKKFKVLWRILIMNWRTVASIILLGLYTGFWIVPTLLSWDVNLSVIPEWGPVLFLLLVTPGIFLASVYKQSLILWVRYQKNYRLNHVPFTYIDGTVLFVLVFGIGIYFSWDQLTPHIHISYLGKLLAITTGISLGIFCVAIYWKGQSLASELTIQPTTNSADYFTDEPIVTEEEDLLDRKQFIEDLCNQIVNYPLPESFVFGLYGRWGEGKTSTLNLVRNKLNQREDVLVLDFDPWVFSSTEALIENFYDGLHKCLNRRFLLPNLRKLIIRYRKLLVSGLKLKGIDFDLTWTDESLNQLKTKIELLIEKTNTKLVILIDDIDRLRDRDGLLQIFKLVKLSGKFKNTVYVLSFDPMEVNGILNPNNSKDFSYLEKIVQARVSLPPAGKEAIDRYLYFSTEDGHVSQIDRLLRNLQIDRTKIEDFEKDFTAIYVRQLSKLFLTLRRAKLYLNGLYQRLPSVKDEIHLQDFLILEVIRVFYPNVYKDITEYRWFYLPSWGEAAFISFPSEINFRDEKAYTLIKRHIETLIKNQEEQEVLLELLQVLFFEVRKAFSTELIEHSGFETEHRRQKRLSHPEVFWKYFTLSVPANELSDQVVESLIDNWNGVEHDRIWSDFESQVAQYSKENRLIEFLRKILLFRAEISDKTSRELIEFLWKNTHLFKREKRSIFEDSEISAATRLLFILIDEKLRPNEIGDVLFDVIEGTPSFELAIRIVDYVRSRKGDLFNIREQGNFAALSTALGLRLTSHFIEGRHNIFYEENSYGYILAQWGTYSSQDNLKINDYVFQLVKENHTILGKVLVVYMRNIGEGIRFLIRREDLVQLYDETKLYELAKRYRDSSYSNDNEKRAVETFVCQYEERKKSAALEITQQSNKQKFMNANKQGLQLFKNGEYLLALEEFNRALDITDWNDEFNWVPQVRMEKWRTLLELALKSEAENRNQYFSAAQKIAANDAEIQELFNAAYPTGADQAPQELYCCILYYLQWDAAPSEEKDAMRSNFETHFSIATSQGTSGHSHEIMTRCGELAAKIRQ